MEKLKNRSVKKICLFSNNISYCGGLERICIKLANELNKFDNFKVYLLSLYIFNKPHFYIDKNVTLRSLFKLGSKIKAFRFFSKNNFIRKWWLYWYLKLNNIDILIDVDTPLTILSSHAVSRLKIKHISWDHFNHYAYEYSKDRKKAFDLNLENKTNVVVLTKADYNYYIKKGYKSDFVTQIYNCSSIECSKWKLPKKSKTIVSVGRYSWEKGFDLLLKAWKIIEDKFPDWQLKIYGPKYNYWDKINLLKNKLELKNISLNTEVDNIESVYKSAEIYACSSRLEGFSLVLLEACNFSLPIVSFDCPDGPGEILINDHNSYLVEEGNYLDFAEKLANLIMDEDKREEFSHNSFERSKKFNTKVFVDQWVDLLNNV